MKLYVTDIDERAACIVGFVTRHSSPITGC